MKSAAFMSGVPIPIRISEPFASLTKFQMEKLEHKIQQNEIVGKDRIFFVIHQLYEFQQNLKDMWFFSWNSSRIPMRIL